MSALACFAALGVVEATAQPAPKPAQLDAAYIAEVIGPVAGGLRREAAYVGNVGLTATLRLGPLVGWRGATAFAYGLGSHGGAPSALIGDAQGTSNIEAPDAWKLYEAWLQQTLLGQHLSVLAGLYDVNTEFDVLRTAALFLNSSHGMGAEFGQSGRNGPSTFPTTSAGLRLKALPLDDLYLQLAVLDGVPGDPARPAGTHVRFDEGDGLLVVAEAALLAGRDEEPAVPPASRRQRARQRRLSRTEDPPYRGKVAVGAWGYTAALPTLDGAGTGRSRGAYLLAEWDVLREAADADQGLAVFARAGLAEAHVNRFGAYTGAGLIYAGPMPGRDADYAGLAVAVAHNGGPYRRTQRRRGAPTTAAEVNVEATYLAQLTPRLSLQADLQYIVDPDTDPARADALVAALRLQAAF